MTLPETMPGKSNVDSVRRKFPTIFLDLCSQQAYTTHQAWLICTILHLLTAPQVKLLSLRVILTCMQKLSRKSPVPGPLPLLCAGGAFGMSRRLRRRIHRLH